MSIAPGPLPQLREFSTDSDANNEYYKFILVFTRHGGDVKVGYMTVDPKKTTTILPKLNYVTWPKLRNLTDFTPVVLKNQLYILGGKEKKANGRRKKEVLKFDPTSNKWADSAPLRRKRWNFAACTFDGKIYIAGGEIPQGTCATDASETYEPFINEWLDEDPIPKIRRNHCLLPWRDKVVLVGGSTGKHFKPRQTNSIWVLEKKWPSGFQADPKYVWSELESQETLLPLVQDNLLCTIHRDVLYIFRDPTKVNFLPKVPSQSNPSDASLLEQRSKRPRLEDTSESLSHKQISPDTLTPGDQCTERLKSGKFSQTTRRAKDLHLSCECISLQQPRTGAGVITLGHRIYLIGGHRPDNPDHCVLDVEYYHTKSRKWFKAFSLGDRSLTDVKCCVLKVPVSNTDFKGQSGALYYRWPLW
ncbi:uncharacterized protein LOC106164439 [Lingula anatina]|uniref:Uncharacterized protein LOC106164439 n=1 Tax=Lingula anatina TaxID=7574 RepID=A0A1S3IJV4_LINAN|nr:uncharacterized protein LOC106164439 [Lingula anatina]|eukprot:XP_013397789.1 uncharacterized protein LOC106164439 [Lingula anatina]